MPIVPTPPLTSTQTTHALVIRARGVMIGAVNSWRDNMTRETSQLFEFGNVTGPYTSESPNSQVSGNAFEKTPNNVTNTSLTVRRYELYQQPFETVFGTSDVTMLSSQLAALDLEESWTTPVAGGAGSYRNVYRGCWFSGRARGFEAQGNREVNTEIQIEYTSKLRVAV